MMAKTIDTDIFWRLQIFCRYFDNSVKDWEGSTISNLVEKSSLMVTSGYILSDGAMVCQNTVPLQFIFDLKAEFACSGSPWLRLVRLWNESYHPGKVLLDRSGHDQIRTFGPISHVSGPEIVFWRNDIMILHHFCWRSSKSSYFD